MTKAAEFIWKKVLEEAKALLERCQYHPAVDEKNESWGNCTRYARFTGTNIVGNNLNWCEEHARKYNLELGIGHLEEHRQVKLLDAVEAYDEVNPS